MKRLALILALVAWCAALAMFACSSRVYGQTPSRWLAVAASRIPGVSDDDAIYNPSQRGINIIPPMNVTMAGDTPVFHYHTVTQHVLRRYSKEDTTQPTVWSTRRSITPSAQLIGWGPQSVIRADANTQNLSSAGSDLRALIITEDLNENTAIFGAGEFNQPTFKPAILRPVLRDFTALGYEGSTANYTDNGFVSNQPGIENPAGVSWPDLYHGIRIKGTGAIVDGVNIFYFPGTAFWCARTGGAVDGKFAPWDVEKNYVGNCSAMRCYRGFEIQVIDTIVENLQGQALRDFGIKFTAGAAQIDNLHFWGVSGSGAPAVWFSSSAGGCWGGPIYAESSPIGMKIESSNNRISPFHSHTCTISNVDLSGTYNVISEFDIEVMAGATGVKSHGRNNTYANGQIELKHTTAIGFAVQSGGNSGKSLVLDNVAFLGTSSSSGTAFTTVETLDRCEIDVDVHTCGIGLDLNPGGVGKIGTGNKIVVRAENCDVPVSLPTGWTTTPTNNANEVSINGVRYYGPGS